MMFRRILAAALAVFVFCAASPAARAQVIPAQSATVLAGAKKDLYPRAVMALDFAGVGTGGTPWYKAGGAISTQPSSLRGYTFSRALAAYAEDIEGKLTLFPAGSPRVTNKGVLIEEARTNLAVYSADTSSSVNWSSVAGSKTNNQSDPFGGSGATLFTGDGTTGSHYLVSNVDGAYTYASGTTYTFSRFVKAGSARYVQLTAPSAIAAASYANFDLQTGSATYSTGLVGSPAIQAYSGGWYRIAITFTATASVPTNGGVVALITTATSGRIESNASTASVYVTGAQVEVGAFWSSFIQTTATMVTRPADVFYFAAGTLPLQNAMTMVAQGGPVANTTAARWFLQTGADASNNRIGIAANSAVNTFVPRYVTGGLGKSAGDITTILNTSANNTGAIAYAIGSNVRAAANGLLSATPGGDPTLLPTQGAFNVGSDNASANQYNGYIQRILVYPFAMSDAELQAATMPGETSALRLDFARGAYKNPAGYVRTNLQPRSQEFDNATWNLARASISANVTTAPDGSLTADKLVEDTSNGDHGVAWGSPLVPGAGTYTASVYLKAAENSYAYVWMDNAGGFGHTVELNLLTGAVRITRQTTGTWTLIGVTATSAGNGWWRLSIVSATSQAYVQLRVYTSQIAWVTGNFGTPSYTGNGTNGTYIWGAQVEATSYATSYIPTSSPSVSVTTYSSTNPADVGNMTFTRGSTGYAEDASGNLVLFGSNVPRITNKGVLMESAATNLLPYSFNDTPAQIWDTLVSVTVGTGSLAPRASGATSTRMTLTASSGRVQRNITVPNDSLARTFSVDVEKKAASYEVSAGYAGGTGVGRILRFDGATGNVTTTPAEQYSVVDKGAWWRVSVTASNNGTGNVTSWNYVGLATGSVGDTVEIALPDYEVGTIATSYKPSRANSNFARSADVFYYTGIPDLAAAGTFAGSWVANSSAANLGVGSLNDGTSNNRADLRGHSFKTSASIRSGGVDQFVPALIGSVVTAGQVQVGAIAWTANRGAISANSSAVTSTGTLTVPVALSRLHVGLLDTISNQLNSFVQRVALYPYAANDNELPYRSAGNF